MSTTRMTQHVRAPRAKVYRALLDAKAVAQWMVPDGMRAAVHAFDAREGGAIRVSLTCDAPGSAGKTSGRTDTYHGRFVKLAANAEIVQTMEFETADPALQGEMTVTYTLADVEGGADVLAVHEHVPPGVAPADNETGWRMSLAKLAALVEAD